MTVSEQTSRRVVQRGLSLLARIAVVSVATLLLIEGLVRIFVPQVLPRDVPELWEPDGAVGWRNRPGARVTANTGDRDVAVCIDSVGDRIDCDLPRTGACSRRVLVVGDSFVQALAVPFAQTVWSRIERATGACVFVAGVAGYQPSQYLEQTRSRLGEGRPFDLVILNFYVGNDFTLDAETIPPAQEVQRRPLHLLPRGPSLADLRDWFYPANSWLESRSQAYVALRFAIRRLRDPAGVGLDGVPLCIRTSRLSAEMMQETARGVALIAREAQQAGASLLIVVLPHRLQVLDPTGERLVEALPELEGDVDMNRVRDRFVPLIEAIPEVDGIIDLLPIFRERATAASWGERDAHFSPDGHALWFDGIRQRIVELLRLPAGG